MQTSDLCNRLGYRFSDPALLTRALTHSSVAAVNNERLEFLGDRVLGLVVAELLTETFPKADEGTLARWFNSLVCAETCADVAKEMDLGAFILMSNSEAASGGRRKKNILADACEAVLGAVFTEAGLDAAKSVIVKFWQAKLGSLDLVIADPKSVLQEKVQARRLPPPRYTDYGREGPDHAPIFTTKVHVEGIRPAIGQGHNKREAEQAAARAMLRRDL